MTAQHVVSVGQCWAHYKRGHYEIIALACIERDEEAAVVYRSLSDGRVWVRPLSEWQAIVAAPAVQRFQWSSDRSSLRSPPGPLREVLDAVGQEIEKAEAEWPPLNSAHEAYAVLLEEVDELWDHVKTNQKRRDLAAMRKEAAQVAAMAIRFIRDICDGDRGRK